MVTIKTTQDCIKSLINGTFLKNFNKMTKEYKEDTIIKVVAASLVSGLVVTGVVSSDKAKIICYTIPSSLLMGLGTFAYLTHDLGIRSEFVDKAKSNFKSYSSRFMTWLGKPSDEDIKRDKAERAALAEEEKTKEKERKNRRESEIGKPLSSGRLEYRAQHPEIFET